MNNGFIFCVYYTSTSSLVITPHSKKLGGKMVIRIVFHFSYEGYLLCCDIFYVGYVGDFLLPASFVMSCSFASDILMSIMRHILLCKNTSSFF